MADGKIQLEVVTPSRRVLSQTVSEVRAPGATGSFGVRPGHMPFIAQMRAGALVATSGEGTVTFAVGEGFVQVAQDRVLVLAQTADRAEDLDLGAVQAEFDNESKKLRALTEADPAFAAQQAKVERAAAKVLVAAKR
jgi:F-type H+-transporting ATPase subunit epsilon